MSGPQGTDPTQPYSGSQPPSDETQAAYQPPQYPSYQQPSTPGYPQQYPSHDQPYAPGQYPQQPGQYPQQPGQPGQFGQQPGQFGQYPQQPDAGSKSKRGLGAVIAVVGVLAAIIVAVVLVLGFWKPGFFVTTKLDITKAQSGVEQVLTDDTNGYGAKNVKDVKCNNGQSPAVKKGDTFDCDVTIDGNFKKVKVTFLDDNGTYEVGRPSSG